MLQRLTILFYLLLSMLTALPLYAETTVSASAKAVNFNYEEFDTNGQTLDKETGIIPGLAITLSNSLSHFSNTISFEAFDGDVDYLGSTQSGAAHTTTTAETLYRLFYKLNWSPEDEGTSIYIKAAWQQWDRDILPAGNISGLFEQYRWQAFEAGITAILFEGDTHKWQFETGVSKTFNGTVDVNLQPQGFGQHKLDMKDGSGFSAMLNYQKSLDVNNSIDLELSHQYWRFGRSNSKTISNGLSTITITEPRNNSSHTILSLRYNHHF